MEGTSPAVPYTSNCERPFQTPHSAQLSPPAPPVISSVEYAVNREVQPQTPMSFLMSVCGVKRDRVDVKSNWRHRMNKHPDEGGRIAAFAFTSQRPRRFIVSRLGDDFDRGLLLALRIDFHMSSILVTPPDLQIRA